MPTYAGKTYDRLIAESDNFVESGAWKILRGIANVVTGGGQNAQAENARMYRAGEVSRTDYKKHRVLNVVRAGATAVVTALTAGRATGPETGEGMRPAKGEASAANREPSAPVSKSYSFIIA